METSDSNVEKGYDKYLEEKFILKLLCSNPIHVFQLILASKIIVEDVLPVLMESPSREIIILLLSSLSMKYSSKFPSLE